MTHRHPCRRTARAARFWPAKLEHPRAAAPTHQEGDPFEGGTASAGSGQTSNALIAWDAGGWASAATVEQVYGHVDVHDSVFAAALEQVWGQRPRSR